MTKSDLKSTSIAELIERFTEVGMAQDNALFDDQIGTFNRLYDKKKEIEAELKARDGDQRSALMSLYDHPNMQVRLNAVKATLAIAPASARQKLEAIATSNHFPQAGDAGMCLINLDKGIFRPT